jgi:hypothetical protein
VAIPPVPGGRHCFVDRDSKLSHALGKGRIEGGNRCLVWTVTEFATLKFTIFPTLGF